MNPKVEWYFKEGNLWQKELTELRAIVLGCDLTEELKWGKPCYQFEGANIVLIHEFKAYCALLFFKGALLKDAKKILVQQTANVQAARQIRFTSVPEIQKLKATVRTYIREAVEVEKSGLTVARKETAEFEMPEEFRIRLHEDANLRAAFDALTPGRQRGYLLHFSAAKQSSTRTSRIEKCAPAILDGRGLND